MFTGIVEETGTVVTMEPLASHAARLRIAASTVMGDLVPGASIAVNGVCLTAVDIAADSFQCDLAPETLSRTNLGSLGLGAIVNLERPLLPTSRLGGHIVQGHVDGTAEVAGMASLGDENWWLSIRVPHSLERYFVQKGSIAIDGVSLTIATLEEDGLVGVTIIPHTYAHTAMKWYKPGVTRVNIECDVLAKHVERLLRGSLSL